MLAPPTSSDKAYPSHLGDGEWALLQLLVAAIESVGFPVRDSQRKIINTMLYFEQSGNQWRAIRHRLPSL